YRLEPIVLARLLGLVPTLPGWCQESWEDHLRRTQLVVSLLRVEVLQFVGDRHDLGVCVIYDPPRSGSSRRSSQDIAELLEVLWLPTRHTQKPPRDRFAVGLMALQG